MQNSKYPFKYHTDFCPAVHSTGVFSLCFQLSLSFVFVLIAIPESMVSSMKKHWKY